MTIRVGYWIIVEIHSEKPKMQNARLHCAEWPNIWPVCPAVQYSTVQYSTAQYMACLPCSTNNIFHRRSPGSTLVSWARKELRVVWVWFLASSRVDTIIIVMWRITREMCPSCPSIVQCPAQCHGMQMLEGAAIMLQLAAQQADAGLRVEYREMWIIIIGTKSKVGCSERVLLCHGLSTKEMGNALLIDIILLISSSWVNLSK